MPDREFNTDEPIGYLITWTTYGTWLPGDQRGSWRRGELQPPNELFRETAAAEMKETVFTLSTGGQGIVENTVARHCDVRSWELHAVNARSNHVHVVVTSPSYAPETVRDQFKSLVYSTSHTGQSRSRAILDRRWQSPLDQPRRRPGSRYHLR